MPRGFVRTLALVAVLFFAFNLCLLAVFPLLTPRTTVGITNTKWKMLERTKGFSGGVLLGDSTAFMCIDPEVLERATGMPWLNMATYGDFGVFDDAIMLSRMIEKGWDIRGIIDSHSYDAFHRTPSGQTLADIPWYLRLPWRKLPAQCEEDAVFESRLRDFLPVYYRQESLANLFQPDSLRLVNWESRFKRGFLDPTDQKPNLEHDIPSHLKHLRSKSALDISRANRMSLVSLVKTAAAHDIPVLFISGPILKTVAQTAEYRRAIDSIDSFIASAAAGHKAIESDFLNQAEFPADNMDRVDHVNSASVALFSEHVARQWNRFNAGLNRRTDN